MSGEEPATTADLPVPRREGAGVAAGLADTALASLATFAVGLAATRLLPDQQLGAYAIFFSAFVLVTTLPTNLVLLPVEVALVGVDRSRRLDLIGRSLRWGAVAAIVAVIPYGAAALFARGDDVGAGSLVALWVTGMAAGLLSPLQDHLRRLFHLADRGKLAVVTSGIQFGGVIAALLVLWGADVADAWIPLGALAAANAISLSVAVLLARARRPAPTAGESEELRLRPVLRSGRWLFVQGVVPVGAGFAANALVGGIAGLALLGRAEAARIVTQPLFVLGGGINASLGPRSMEAGRALDQVGTRRLRNAYWKLIVPLAVLYLAIVSWDVVINPMIDLVPLAYETRGLVLVAGIAALLTGLSLPVRSELLGMREERGLTRIDTIASAARVAVAGATAAALNAFSIHVGGIVDGVVKTVGRTRLADRRLARGDRRDKT